MLRIVSLSPAITQMVQELGLGQEIVAVGAYDPAAPAGVPVVGDLFQLDYEKLIAVQPTHIFLQPGQQGVPPLLANLARRKGWTLCAYSIHRIDDALYALHDPAGPNPSACVGEVLQVGPIARSVAGDLRRRLVALGRLLEKEPRPRVLLLVGLDPITAAGPDTFLGEMLEIAGGANVLAPGGNSYPVLDKERVLALAPESVVCVHSTEPGDDTGGRKTDPLAGLDLPAARSRRIFHLRDRLALLPSTSMPRIAARLASLLHPERSLEIERAAGSAAGP
jgi:iron complex transport system substrate-binding protein